MTSAKLRGVMLAGLSSFGLLACSGSPKPKASPPIAASARTGGQAAAPAVAAAPSAPPGPAAVQPSESVEEPGSRELRPGDEANGAAALDEPALPASDPSALLHDALEAYNSADTLWEQGAADDAFAALDHAYERMSQLQADGDAILAQEKENLRHLISRRIVEIYASRQTAVGNPDASIPRVSNAEVQQEIASFQGRERDFFVEAYQRSGLYRPMIVERLREAGLPEQLSWLPLVESGFKERALSRARALGMWQFISSTGYRYGLDRSSWIDERMDPEKSTASALAYLTALHDLFGDWLTALAAYNCGEHAVLREISHQKLSYFDQFWDLYARLPRETRRYVPRFLATLAIVENPANYGFDLPAPLPRVEYEPFEIARATQLEALDRALALPPGTLAKLNPELRGNASPDAAYRLKIPPGSSSLLQTRLAELPKWSPPAGGPTGDIGVHRVRSGETLSGIAERYRTSVPQLMALNRLRSADQLSLGQQLRVPGGGASSGASASGGSGTSGGGAGIYVVRRGDTLGSIAQGERVALSRLLAANQLSERSTIYPGQQLTIPD